MHKKIIITMLLALTVMLTQAQPIKVEYEYRTKTLPELMQQYFQMQNVQHLRVTLKGNFNGKRAKLKKVACSNGAFSEQELLPEFVHFLLVDSVESLDFMAVPYGKDSLHICCFYPASNNQPIFNDTVRMDNMKILILLWLIPLVFRFRTEFGFAACVIRELSHENGLKSMV